MRRLRLLVPLILATPLARAEVVAASAAGFEVRDSAVVKAPPDRVYAGLLQIGRWWNPQHTWSGDAAHLSLDAKPGGCFCETLPDGGGVRHMTVSFVMPGKLLRLDGALGPLQGEGLAGSMTWSLAPADGGTTLTLDYKVGGYAARPLPEWAGAVDGVLAEQFQRLRRWIETGKPE
ncbi:MAG: SRPBCC domain-containing protein [Nevskiaceae bacterium]|nr:MAG: SRPBCC domain-containing protein [Nevskiaceae bacterium]